eukprot:scaffold1954_cov268-Pinguiococcus_pyrenoidosus.AAC.31
MEKWISCYSYNIIKDRELFGGQLETAVAALPKLFKKHSEPLRDFAIRALNMDPTQRLDTEEMLTHAWLEGAASVDDAVLRRLSRERRASGSTYDELSPGPKQNKAGIRLSSKARRLFIDAKSAKTQISLPPVDPQTPSIASAAHLVEAKEDVAEEKREAETPAAEEPATEGEAEA